MKTKNDSFFKLLKINTFNNLISPSFYVSGIIFILFSVFQFFILQNFFGSNSTDLHYFFTAIPYINSLIIPVLTLGIKDNEFVPLSDLKYLLCNWLTVLIEYSIFLITLTAIPMCVSFFGKVEVSCCISGFFMLFLYGSASAALCIFFKILFSNSLISIIISCVCLITACAAHIVSLYINNSLVTFFVKAVSFSWHFDAAGKGIIDSRDLIYFILVTTGFILLSNFVVLRRKEIHFSRKQKVQIASLILIFVFGLLDSSRLYFRKDISSFGKYSISKTSKKLIQNLENHLSIVYYRSESLKNLYPQVRDVSDYLREFAFSKNISFSIQEPEKNGNAQLLENYGISGRQIQTYGQNQTGYLTVYSAVILEYGGKWEAIPFVLGTESLEYDLYGRILHLLNEKDRIVDIIIANGKNLNQDYSYLVPWLNNQGFICNEIDIFSPLKDQFTSESHLLLVAGSSELTEDQCAQLENEILNGKNALFFVNPYDSDIENTWHITQIPDQPLINMLENYGFGFSTNLACDISCGRIIMQSEKTVDGQALDSTFTQNINYPLWINLMPQTKARKGVTEFWPVSMESLCDNISPVLISSSAAWEIKPDLYSSENLFITDPFKTDQLMKAKETNAVLTLGLELNGKLKGLYQNTIREDTKILVIPDQYFVNSLMLGYIGGSYGDYRNLDFVVNQLLLLNNEPELAKLQEKSTYTTQNTMYKTPDLQSFKKAQSRTLFICIFVLPLLYIFAFIVMIRIRHSLIKKEFND